MAEREASDVGVVVLVGGDLMARARVESAARQAGVQLVSTRPTTLETTLEQDPASLVIIDLDDGGESVLRAVVAARSRNLVPERVVGYFSHVDTELGEAARAAGCEALPRGRFYRELSEILRGA